MKKGFIFSFVFLVFLVLSLVIVSAGQLKVTEEHPFILIIIGFLLTT